LSDAIRGTLDDEGRDSGHDPSDPSRRRTGNDALPRDAQRANRVPALLPPDEPGAEDAARTSDQDLLHRLRSRDGPGGGAAQSRNRRERDSWSGPYDEDSRHQRGGGRRVDQRQVAGPWSGQGVTVAAADRG